MTADIRTAALAEARGADMHHELSFAHYTRVFTAGAVWAAERVTPTREQVAAVLRGIGLSDLPDEYDSSIHSWRCEHPGIYGRCSCFDDAVNDLVALMTELTKEGKA